MPRHIRNRPARKIRSGKTWRGERATRFSQNCTQSREEEEMKEERRRGREKVHSHSSASRWSHRARTLARSRGCDRVIHELPSRVYFTRGSRESIAHGSLKEKRAPDAWTLFLNDIPRGRLCLALAEACRARRYDPRARERREYRRGRKPGLTSSCEKERGRGGREGR